jgi:hypothetical protein
VKFIANSIDFRDVFMAISGRNDQYVANDY